MTTKTTHIEQEHTRNSTQYQHIRIDTRSMLTRHMNYSGYEVSGLVRISLLRITHDNFNLPTVDVRYAYLKVSSVRVFSVTNIGDRVQKELPLRKVFL